MEYKQLKLLISDMQPAHPKSYAISHLEKKITLALRTFRRLSALHIC